MLKNIPVRGKFTLLLVICLLGFIALQIESAMTLKNMLLSEKQTFTREMVSSASSLLNTLYQKELSGEITREDAQARAKDYIQHLKYDSGKGYFWVHNQDNHLLVHGEKPHIAGKDVSDLKDVNGKYVFRALTEKALQQGSGFVDYYWNRAGDTHSSAKISYVEHFKPWGWIIGTGIYIDDVDAHMWEQVILSGELIAAVVLLASLIIWRIAESMIASIKEVRESMDYISAKGDLTHRVKLQSKDEIGSIATTFNNMMINFQDTVQGIRQGSLQLEEHATNLATVTEQTSQGSHIQQMETEKILSAISLLNTNVEDVNQSVASSNETGQQALTMLNQAVGDLSQSQRQFSELTQTMQSSVEDINALATECSRIGDILSAIQEIADQTNLLALNAAIEAARAGEQGRGFAVVADEVRSLAQKTHDATSDVGLLLESLQAKANRSVDSMANSVEHTHRSNTQLAETEEKARRANQAIQGIVEENHRVFEKCEEQRSLTRDLNLMSEQITAIASQNAAGATELARNGEELAGLSHQFTNQVAHFTA
ncbi:methyl-accepting chemotaxis protein [Oceanospirillum sediminis]|uniref:Methyl-accepting chemotaxis protein n=1 Tax=Oceanospirillum sediminis TaxID=2760088 RepID=A0A839IN59_9GAMM|nr:methyl-accepting chemotaxis protein [Oceanospirillum sediminis]MBB1485939.1 methyl-accepting chemotaxis protein [Oceanospirillum sediminis]